MELQVATLLTLTGIVPHNCVKVLQLLRVFAHSASSVQRESLSHSLVTLASLPYPTVSATTRAALTAPKATIATQTLLLRVQSAKLAMFAPRRLSTKLMCSRLEATSLLLASLRKLSASKAHTRTKKVKAPVTSVTRASTAPISAWKAASSVLMAREMMAQVWP